MAVSARLALALFLASVAQQATAQPKPAENKPLEGTSWKATELGGKPTPSQDPSHEAHLLFQAGSRVSGSNGCNRITGSYELKGEAVTFSQMAGTQMACIGAAADVERAFQGAIKAASRLNITGDRLELFDAADKRVAAFTGRAPASASTSPKLEGTSWQLVKFQGSDDKTLTPDDGAKYTIDFSTGGQMTARIDCNRGRGTWKSSGPNQIQFSPLALTKASVHPGPCTIRS
jgi:heat shock protein HslJ